MVEKEKLENDVGARNGIVAVNPKPKNGVTSKVIDFVEKLIVKWMYDSSQPLHYLSGNFAPVPDETPPTKDLHVIGRLPDCLNGEFVRVGPNPKFAPVAGYHWFDGDGMIHGLRIKDGKATYVSRFVRTSRLKQEEFFGGAKFMKIGDLKGLFGLLMVNMQMLRAKLKVLDVSYGNGTANTALVYHHGKLLALSEADKPYAVKVLEDGDLQTLGMIDYDKRLQHSFTAHPKVDPYTGEMFTFGYAHTPPYITYRVISKDGFMHDPVPITISDPILMHDFAITENYAIFMDLPLYFRPKEMVKENKLIFTFDDTKKARFGILPRYAKNEAQMKWYEMRFNLKTGLASQKRLSASAVDFPRVNECYTGRKQRYVYGTILDSIAKVTGIIKFDLHAEPDEEKTKLEVGGNVRGIFDLGPGRFGSEAVFVPREPGTSSEEDDGYLIFFSHDEKTGKSSVNVIDAKTMSADPVAVVELPHRVPYGFHAFFVSEEQLEEQAKL
ncbi:Carotenoid 9,10(9',10')-cleavage dioxygenase 1 [Citrus sinensis]|uniref:Carotenoid 9,10(9',10')-cleavage dioxygenase 1 n=1 Tax=Citrus sinensis TaxID=2711 RepID=A0ACB8LLX8_CITSI|nr:Carotenoid 9,10(9',10')-cleavage dioxygenase 1 [Citrus sinensis]